VNTKRRALALLGCAAALGGAAPGCSQEPAPRGRVLLIGIDGASPRLTRPLIEKGLLPNLEDIARRGVAGQLRAHHPLLSPRIWTSIATGKAPEQHGIHSWVFKGESGRPRMYRSSDRKTHALWNIASAAGLQVGVVNWLNTYPPEIVNGAMISDFAIPGERQAKEGLGELFAESLAGQQLAGKSEDTVTTHPADWERALEAMASEAEPPTRFTDAEATQKDLRPGAIKVLTNSYTSDRLVTTAALEVEAATKPDLLMVYLSGVDRSSHFLWGGFEPASVYAKSVRFSPAEKRAAAQAIRRIYGFSDSLVGELAARYGEDDLVIVVSDHGFEARVKGDRGLTGTHDSKRAEMGVVFARGPGIEAGATVGELSVNDITPTILRWLGLPVGEDMDGRPAAFLAAGEIRRVPTHDGAKIERAKGRADEVESTYIDELRALGYVDDGALPEKAPADE
jgi:predicted AlkP superfamily phosphohydrolase/phosphomutase